MSTNSKTVFTVWQLLQQISKKDVEENLNKEARKWLNNVTLLPCGTYKEPRSFGTKNRSSWSYIWLIQISQNQPNIRKTCRQKSEYCRKTSVRKWANNDCRKLRIFNMAWSKFHKSCTISRLADTLLRRTHAFTMLALFYNEKLRANILDKFPLQALLQWCLKVTRNEGFWTAYSCVQLGKKPNLHLRKTTWVTNGQQAFGTDFHTE